MNPLSVFRILVIDDNPQMRTIIGTILAGAGVRELFYASDGERGLEAVCSLRPDVVFVDYEMPRLKGLDFISRVRAIQDDRRFTTIIMLTGHSDLLRLAEARDRGVNDFLTKPVSAKILLGRLAYAIDHPRPFVDSPSYFGPDRRRRCRDGYDGPLRRASDRVDVFEI